MALLWSTIGMGQLAPLTQADSAQLFDALSAYGTGRTNAHGTWWVRPADSAGFAPFARALRTDVRMAGDSAAPRCHSTGDTSGPTGNLASAQIIRLLADSIEVRITLRCLGGSVQSPMRLGSILMYALVRRDERWRVVALRALVS
jgi:hypothetical protein